MQKVFYSLVGFPLGSRHHSELCPALCHLDLCPGEVEAAAIFLGETQKILGQAMVKVKQTIYFQTQWSDESISV